MRQSKLFTKTKKDAPKDEVSNNAKLLIRGGFIHKEMAGVYTYLPLGLRVFKKIEDVIRSEMNRIEGQEMKMTTLQDPEIWRKSGRWAEEGKEEGGLPWFKTELSAGGEIGIANTHEEALANILRQYVSSYKDLPIYAYQFQNKFRNELRAKSGIMRTREFVMKDLYSFSKSEEEHKQFYERCAEAYLSIFKLVGLGGITYRTFASGGSFSKFSDEFQTVSDAGEDVIYINEKENIAVNKEVYTDEVLEELGFDKSELVEKKSIEVGNIFPLGTRFPEALGLRFSDAEGGEQPIVMGSYGIGLGRLLGTVAEVLSDEKGLVWPATIAPFDIHLVALSSGDEKLQEHADKLYERLVESGVDVLYDDRDLRAGEKFADSDLIGIPQRVVLSERTFKEGKVELVDRASGESALVVEESLFGAE